MASLNDTLYGVTTTRYLANIDPASGNLIQVGSASRFGLRVAEPEALTAFEDKLYMIDRANDALMELSPRTGVATQVGSAVQFGAREGEIYGLTVYNRQLIMVSNFGNIRLVDPALGTAAELLADVGTRPTDFETHNGLLYLVNFDRSALFTVS